MTSSVLISLILVVLLTAGSVQVVADELQTSRLGQAQSPSDQDTLEVQRLQLAKRVDSLSSRIDDLEKEHHLRVQAQYFTSEISLFDEHLPEGRTLLAQSEQGSELNPSLEEGSELSPPLEEESELSPPLEEGSELSPPFEEGDGIIIAALPSGIAPDPTLSLQDALVSRREQASEDPMLLEDGAGREILGEIRRLETRRQEMRRLEAEVRARIEALQKRLEGRE